MIIYFLSEFYFSFYIPTMTINQDPFVDRALDSWTNLCQSTPPSTEESIHQRSWDASVIKWKKDLISSTKTGIGGLMVSVLDSQPGGAGFDSRPGTMTTTGVTPFSKVIVLPT